MYIVTFFFHLQRTLWIFIFYHVTFEENFFLLEVVELGKWRKFSLNDFRMETQRCVQMKLECIIIYLIVRASIWLINSLKITSFFSGSIESLKITLLISGYEITLIIPLKTFIVPCLQVFYNDHWVDIDYLCRFFYLLWRNWSRCHFYILFENFSLSDFTLVNFYKLQ